jgi:hypothetical protein
MASKLSPVWFVSELTLFARRTRSSVPEGTITVTGAGFELVALCSSFLLELVEDVLGS